MQRGPKQKMGWSVGGRTGRVIALVAVLGGVGASALAMSEAGASATVVIASTKNASLGTVLVSANRTVYTLNKKDCNAKCLSYWPAVVLPKGATKASAGTGVTAAKLGKVKDAKGAWQVTYAGKALYFYVGDKGKGQVNGNKLTDTWGLWSVVVTAKPASGAPTTTTTAPSGGGVSF